MKINHTNDKLWIKKHRNGGKKMETWEGKSFSITDPKGVSTVIYQIIKTPKESPKNSPSGKDYIQQEPESLQYSV